MQSVDGRIDKTGESFLAPDAHVVAIHPTDARDLFSAEGFLSLKDVGKSRLLRIMRGRTRVKSDLFTNTRR